MCLFSSQCLIIMSVLAKKIHSPWALFNKKIMIVSVGLKLSCQRLIISSFVHLFMTQRGLSVGVHNRNKIGKYKNITIPFFTFVLVLHLCLLLSLWLQNRRYKHLTGWNLALNCYPRKLKTYGLSQNSIRFLASYLINWFQSVKIGDAYSSWLSLHKGVCQGSVIKHLLTSSSKISYSCRPTLISIRMLMTLNSFAMD